MSFNNYVQLPNPNRIRQLLLSQVKLDIILNNSSDKWLRVTSYKPNYTKNTSLFTINNGAGDLLHIISGNKVMIIKGFSHESELSPYLHSWGKSIVRYMYRDLPWKLWLLIKKEILKNDVTFCMWYNFNTNEWEKGDTYKYEFEEINQECDDGESFLLSYICENKEEWLEWAKDYYELENIDEVAVEKVYSDYVIDNEIISAINPERDCVEVLKEMAELDILVNGSN